MKGIIVILSGQVFVSSLKGFRVGGWVGSEKSLSQSIDSNKHKKMGILQDMDLLSSEFWSSDRRTERLQTEYNAYEPTVAQRPWCTDGFNKKIMTFRFLKDGFIIK